jgi:hypothetical protein
MRLMKQRDNFILNRTLYPTLDKVRRNANTASASWSEIRSSLMYLEFLVSFRWRLFIIILYHTATIVFVVSVVKPLRSVRNYNVLFEKLSGPYVTKRMDKWFFFSARCRDRRCGPTSLLRAGHRLPPSGGYRGRSFSLKTHLHLV